MDTANLFLENTVLLLAVLLFLAVLPRALRQKKKTELDRAVERFEKEELKASAEKKPGEGKNNQQKPIALRDGSLAYLKGDLPAPKKIDTRGGIPPFPSEEEDEEERVKVVKPGVPISHYETVEPPQKNKVKLIKQEFSIAPDKNKTQSKKAPPTPTKAHQDKTHVRGEKPSSNEDLPMPPIAKDDEPKDSWIEAEIPGLTIEPTTLAEEAKDIPVFNAFPKEINPSDTEKTPETSKKEKQGIDVKNIASKTEEKEDLISSKQSGNQTESQDLKMKTSESSSKEVEIKAPVVSHKNITKKEVHTEKTEAPPSNNKEAQVAKVEKTEILSQQDDAKTSPETVNLKPFLLDIRYLDEEGSENGDPVSHEKLPAGMIDVTIARLSALQASLENQLVSIPGEQSLSANSASKNMRNDRMQDSHPDLEEIIDEISNKKEVSLDELDSFLFTATQRKK